MTERSRGTLIIVCAYFGGGAIVTKIQQRALIISSDLSSNSVRQSASDKTKLYKIPDKFVTYCVTVIFK